MTNDSRAGALAGPWRAVLADLNGDVYASVAAAPEGVEDQDEPVTISVVRGTALPVDRGGDLCAPGTYHSGDVAYELDGVDLEDDDPSVGADARFIQAEAMSAGLNAAGAP
jgi:hypothetical protein